MDEKDSDGQDHLRNRYFSAKELEEVCEAWIEKVDVFQEFVLERSQDLDAILIQVRLGTAEIE
ncbi:13329_t:CDS:2, partial [Racocetra fulgida]